MPVKDLSEMLGSGPVSVGDRFVSKRHDAPTRLRVTRPDGRLGLRDSSVNL